MSRKRIRTFEETINAVLRYQEYIRSWDKARFQSKFGYLSDDELDSFLQLAREIKTYATQVAGTLFTLGEAITAETKEKMERLKAMIRDKYTYLDRVRLERLTAGSTYNAIV